ncbi:glycerol acyltransferase [Hydrococcus rivularis NIES-593]|uniref:Glycerol acyltransferase n=1 Tax=Hydrococcus rivularis NIES-593 TaxID=1921803 RepID=A0A1U7HLT5_9CYAN|nr:1-acyl-sn-glycerol-3-phosphate acyltransferase [Hydrococcus rivularis]OKH24511.1 glycerol acyltransferase [Hydrococcus rivularis NIES-593]
MHQAHPKLEFISPAFNGSILKITQRSLPILLKFRLKRWLPAGISRIDAVNVETLAELYHQFQTGKIRLLLAFRHCQVDDPLCGLYLLSRVPQVARRKGIALQSPIHSHFIYERGMPLWAGAWLGWLLSRLGGIPIHRGKPFDWTAIKTVRKLLIDGDLPMALAPEGATNGYSEIVSPLEPGAAQLGFWCVEDLLKANRPEQVYIVPIGIQYGYVKPQWSRLDWLLRQLEADCGLLSRNSQPEKERELKKIYAQRLFRLGEYLITEMEQFYRRFYHQNLPSDPRSAGSKNLTTRLHQLLDVALRVGEEYFGLQSKGTIIERCRRLEEAGWTYIYREDISDLKTLSPLHRGLADWVAQEANLRMLHMRLVESFVAVTESYLQENLSFERLAETALLIFDVLARIKTRKMPRRPRLGWRWARITVGEAISVSDRWHVYQSSRQAAKQAVADLTQDLHVALEKMISKS